MQQALIFIYFRKSLITCGPFRICFKACINKKSHVSYFTSVSGELNVALTIRICHLLRFSVAASILRYVNMRQATCLKDEVLKFQ